LITITISDPTGWRCS